MRFWPKRIVLVMLVTFLAGCTGASDQSRSKVAAAVAPAATGAAAAADALPSAGPASLVSGVATQVAGSGLPAFSHVFIIVMENKGSNLVMGNDAAPFFNQLAGQYAYAANYYAVSHPSLPNYLALTGGNDFGKHTDCTDCFVGADNLADQLEAAGRSWKAYMESMPEPCYQGPDTDLYARRHNPFFYYNDVRTNPARCKNIVPLTQLQSDLQSGNVPDFAWISPNLCNDMHNCSVGTGDSWLRTWIARITATAAWKDRGVIFVTFDEGSSNAGCCTYAAGGKVSTIAISPLARAGYRSQVAYDHYSLLRTIEKSWGLPLLDRAGCDCSLPMVDLFVKP